MLESEWWVRGDSFKVLVLCMMSQNRRRPPLEALGLNAPRCSIVGLQWGLSADTEHMEWIMGLITNIQGLPGVTQKAHNALFLAWAAWQCRMAKLEDSAVPLMVQCAWQFALLHRFIATNATAYSVIICFHSTAQTSLNNQNKADQRQL